MYHHHHFFIDNGRTRRPITATKSMENSEQNSDNTKEYNYFYIKKENRKLTRT